MRGRKEEREGGNITGGKEGKKGKNKTYYQMPPFYS